VCVARLALTANRGYPLRIPVLNSIRLKSPIAQIIAFWRDYPLNKCQQGVACIFAAFKTYK
jgi:hypothetical protein